jgi:NADPH:quinone reductase-like Zn-dependent oxidoreductase
MSIETMQAIRVHAYGGPEQLKLERIPRPQPLPGELLIRVHAAGVLPADCYTRQGRMAALMRKDFPYTPGTAFAGVIEALGAGVTTFQRGQAICGRSPQGTYAEYTTVLAAAPVPALEGASYRQAAANSPLALMPAVLGFDEAATLSGGASTAWTALFEDGGLQAGQRVLIHAAAGGVGSFAVQFAKWKGAQVIATASAANLDFVRSLGADMAIDYQATPFEEVAREVDLVLDAIGGATLQRSMHVVKRGGTLVSLLEAPPAELAQELGIRASKNAVLPTSAHLQSIVRLIDAGQIRPTVGPVFALEQAAQAHALCETGHGRGRIVLHVPG